MIWTKRHQSYNMLQWRCEENIVWLIQWRCEEKVVKIIKKMFQFMLHWSILYDWCLLVHIRICVREQGVLQMFKFQKRAFWVSRLYVANKRDLTWFRTSSFYARRCLMWYFRKKSFQCSSTTKFTPIRKGNKSQVYA